jgi:hypothetical protein
LAKTRREFGKKGHPFSHHLLYTPATSRRGWGKSESKSMSIVIVHQGQRIPIEQDEPEDGWIPISIR